MLKATKLTLAALFAGGQLWSRGRADRQRRQRRRVDRQAGEPRHDRHVEAAVANEVKGGGPAMQQKNTGMQQKTGPTNPANAGPDESGTAKDTAGSGTQRDPAAQKQ